MKILRRRTGGEGAFWEGSVARSFSSALKAARFFDDNDDDAKEEISDT